MLAVGQSVAVDMAVQFGLGRHQTTLSISDADDVQKVSASSDVKALF